MIVRRAQPDEARVVADLWLRSRYASIPANPEPIHTDEEVRGYFAEVVFPRDDVWVADDGTVVGMIVLRDGWIDHLHVEPARTGEGIGSQLLETAPPACDLWTFQANDGARRFYERHGFVAVEFTDGDNEEGAPDVHYRRG